MCDHLKFLNFQRRLLNGAETAEATAAGHMGSFQWQLYHIKCTLCLKKADHFHVYNKLDGPIFHYFSLLYSESNS